MDSKTRRKTYPLSVSLRGVTPQGRPLNKSWMTTSAIPDNNLHIDAEGMTLVTEVIEQIEIILSLLTDDAVACDVIHELIHSTKRLHKAASV